MSHPSFAELLDYLAQKLSSSAQAEVESHLATCPTCQQTLLLARQTLGAPQPAKLVAPPADLVQRAVAAFRRSQQQLVERVQVAATLQFDNFAQGAALGARGVIKERQLLYTFDEFDLDLQISPAPSAQASILRGQLQPHTVLEGGLAGITVQLASERYGPWLRLTDATGFFHFSTLQADDYRLQLQLETRDVLITPLVLPG